MPLRQPSAAVAHLGSRPKVRIYARGGQLQGYAQQASSCTTRTAQLELLPFGTTKAVQPGSPGPGNHIHPRLEAEGRLFA